MRPKLFLDIASPRRASPGGVAVEASAFTEQGGVTASISVTDNGSLKLVSRSQLYRFTPEGLECNPSTSGRPPAYEQHSYKIAERDVRILRVLGRGASSVVYKGYYQRGNCFVAVKKINCFEKEKRHQMMNDVKALCEVDDAGLVRFVGAYHAPENGQIALVLEYMDGGSLGDVLEKKKSVPENILSAVTGQVLQGLSYLHRCKHTVHRDIKPANILINLSGDAKIADFGISAFVDSTLAVCHTFLGTVTYMSPERINSEPYSFPSDIWSLGLTLLECATGRYPYDASAGPLQLMIQVVEEAVPLPAPGACSEDVRDFVRQCMRKDPLQRPSAEGLLSHPFILKHARRRTDLRPFLRELANPDDRVEEASVALTAQYYTAMAAGYGASRALGGLYADDAVLVYEGVRVAGRAAVVAHLAAVAERHAAYGSAAYDLDAPDAQALQDGSVVLHIGGRLRVGGSGPLAMGPQGAGPPTAFSEAFVLQPGVCGGAQGAVAGAPAAAGVYAVYDSAGVLQYVGLSRKIAVSLANHARDLPELAHAVKYAAVSDATRDNLTAAWKAWVEQAVDESGQVPPGNAAGNTQWTARRARPEIRLTPGKGLADLKCSVEDLIDGVVKSNKVVAFVKGTRTAPQCGFSHRVMSLLTEVGAPFDAVNVLDETYNPGLRDAIKAYSQWPTIPQVYVNGEFVGGADILEELARKGELQQLAQSGLAADKTATLTAHDSSVWGKAAASGRAMQAAYNARLAAVHEAATTRQEREAQRWRQHAATLSRFRASRALPASEERHLPALVEGPRAAVQALLGWLRATMAAVWAAVQATLPRAAGGGRGAAAGAA
ncbi:hypothetical protein WJX81_001306 [Elliptochloris bilobata]|uniref:mitogen-activated protein kinase kinase n=1 Tax=Elliptochloris bilobata TaxID=381761 RepID=A0AAW1QHU7_9CHLO